MLSSQISRKNSVKNDRIKQIENKINTISQKKIQTAKEERHSDTANRIQAIEKSSADTIRIFENKIKQLKQQLNTFQRKFDENKSQNHLSISNRTKEINQLQTKLRNTLYHIIYKAKENEKKIASMFQEKLESLYTMLAKQKQKRKTFFEKLDSDLSVALPETSDEIKEGFYNSFIKMKDIESRVNLEIEELFQTIDAAKKKEEENFEQFLNMVASIIESVKEEIGIEKQNRQKCKQKLLGLFEGAYNELVHT